MSSLYSNEVRHYLRSKIEPIGIYWWVEEFDEFLRLYILRNDINALSGEEKLRLANVINETLGKISRDGIPIYVKVDNGERDPRNRVAE